MFAEERDDIFVKQPTHQTLKAWEPFWDCVEVLFNFMHYEAEEDHIEWRFLWVGGIALLRTVGHVLQKVDSGLSIKHKDQIHCLWDEWKVDRQRHRIFWEFILQERNNLLKTYTFGASMKHVEGQIMIVYNDEYNALNPFRAALYWGRDQLELLETRLVL